MQALPHHYQVHVSANTANNLSVSVTDLPKLEVAPPANFGGPGDIWSPEDLFMSSITSCFILSFKAIARAAKLDWVSIECHSEGTLERVNGKTLFTTVVTQANLVVAAAESIENAEKLLHKADQTCLVSNSITCEIKLECVVSNKA